MADSDLSHESATGRPAKPPAPQAKDRPFFGRVEALRGLGALAVAGYHFSGSALHGTALLPRVAWENMGPLQNALGSLSLVLFPAHAALMVFFVISGFLLRVSLEHGPQQVSAATGRFLLGRAFRLYPIVIFTVLLTPMFLRYYAVDAGASPASISASRLIANMCLLDVSMNGELWALQVELLMVPVILGLYFLERRSGPNLLLAIALVVTVLAYMPRWALWRPLSTNVFPFVLGMVVPTLGRRFVSGLSLRAAIAWALAVGTMLLLTQPCFGLFSRTSAVIEAYAAAILISLVAYRNDVSVLRCLDVKPLRLLGLSSGSYYVLHMKTAPLALAIASAIIPLAWSAHCPVLVGWLVLPIWLCAIVPLTVCTFHLIETPGIALGRRIVGMCRLA